MKKTETRGKTLDRAVAQMRQQWDERATQDAMYYIASGNNNWGESDFVQSGEQDVARIVDPFLESIALTTSVAKMLEIGCGVGRMTFGFARRFHYVYGIDISAEMIKRARNLQARLGVMNVRFELGNGKDLAFLADQTVDFCFSYIVFQHIPNFEVTQTYIREIGRVLKPGGFFLFQVNGYPHCVLPGSVYLFWGVRETGLLKKWGITRRPFLRLGKLDTWHGVPVRRSNVLAACNAASLQVTRIIGEGSQYMWVLGTKRSDR